MGEETNVDHVVVYRDAAEQFRWRAVAGNGEVVSEGEAHTRASDAGLAAHNILPTVPIFREATGDDGEKVLIRTVWR